MRTSAATRARLVARIDHLRDRALAHYAKARETGYDLRAFKRHIVAGDNLTKQIAAIRRDMEQ
jgi:hypothetical protein